MVHTAGRACQAAHVTGSSRIRRVLDFLLAGLVMACALALPASAGAARPAGLGQRVGDARLLVHYTTGGPEAITDAAAQQVLAAAGRAYDAYRSWGWPDPPSDATGPADANNPDGRIDVYVHAINSPDDPQGITRSDAGYTGLTLPSYIELQPAAAAKPVVVSHELFHVFQAMAPVLPEGQEAIERIGAFLQKQLTAAAAAG